MGENLNRNILHENSERKDDDTLMSGKLLFHHLPTLNALAVYSPKPLFQNVWSSEGLLAESNVAG